MVACIDKSLECEEKCLSYFLIFRTCITPWSDSPDTIFASDRLINSGQYMTPFIVFKFSWYVYVVSQMLESVLVLISKSPCLLMLVRRILLSRVNFVNFLLFSLLKPLSALLMRNILYLSKGFSILFGLFVKNFGLLS